MTSLFRAESAWSVWAHGYLFLQLIKQLQKQLPGEHSVERSRIFIGKHVIPVGDNYRDAFYQKLRG